MINRLISIAPMMDCTDRHDRYFLRLISPSVLLYTEMVTTGALIYGDVERHLRFNQFEQPVALQLGGSNPLHLAKAAKLGESFGYDEINLNVGCPSDRVQQGRIGACLMLEPELVAECVRAMNTAVKIPVTVKCRIGVDEIDSYEALTHFINIVSQAGCHVFIIHARKAWLKGLSPKQNREIPPLQYETVYKIKKDFPHLTIILNGGVKNIQDIQLHLTHTDGVMIGREAYNNPYLLAAIEKDIFLNNDAVKSREKILTEMVPYIDSELKKCTKLSSITRHLFGLYQGERNSKVWRRFLSEQAHLRNDAELINESLLVFDK